MKVFRHNAGIPCAAGSRDERGNQVREDRRQNQLAPSLPATKAIDVAGFFKLGRNSGGAGDHVKQQIPLRAQQKQKDGCNTQSAAHAHQGENDDWKQCRGGN